MGRLDGKVVLITGGARGQGAEEGRLFASEGATVVLTDVLDDDGHAAAAESGCEYVHLDVRSEEEWATVVADVVDRHGHIDVLVNNAANRPDQAAGRDDPRRVGTGSSPSTRRASSSGMRTVSAAMVKAERGGSIVNISSVAGLEAVAHHGAYSGTKWAVRGLTKVAALEWGRYGIRVNSVHPGVIETPMTADNRMVTDPDLRRKMERSISLGRYGQPGDIANMVLFLASDDSAYCTGQEFTVDGGIHH